MSLGRLFTNFLPKLPVGMTKIKLLQQYKSNIKGDVIEVSDQEATVLIRDSVARLTFGRDYIVKPQGFGGEIESKAFESSPITK